VSLPGPVLGLVSAYAKAGANVVAAKGPDGALLVDGGTAEGSAALVRLVLKTTGAKRVQTLFNTH